jgi:hypothetical protein
MAIKVSNYLSACPLFIRMVFAETDYQLAVGTGFIYEQDDFYYLITNGHCITGINPETGERLSEKAGFPTVIKVGVRTMVPGKDLGEELLELKDQLEQKEQLKQRKTNVAFATIHPEKPIIDLYEDEDYQEPTWFIHPEFGYNVDVVAIPICHKDKVPKHLLLYPLNTSSILDDSTRDIEPRVADDVYILGYPFGITDPLEFPIWKRGSIATEPSISYKGLPKMLVDTATRSGMSGSPVILMRTGIHDMENGVPTNKTSIGTLCSFLGVYSGRIGADDEVSAQLGIVWRKEVIEEILRAKVKGTIEFK